MLLLWSFSVVVPLDMCLSVECACVVFVALLGLVLVSLGLLFVVWCCSGVFV